MTRRFLALGDSYTIGEGVATDERWPERLVRALRAEGAAIADPEIVAKTGWTTDELEQAVERASTRAPFDLVTLLIGVNDQYRGRGVNRFTSSFRAVLHRALALSGNDPARALVISIPDWSVTPFAERDPRGAPAIAAEIDGFNEIVAREARETQVTFVDITPISRAAGASPALLAADGLHPSAAMYARWLDVLLPAARRAIA